VQPQVPGSVGAHGGARFHDVLLAGGHLRIPSSWAASTRRIVVTDALD
jgi:hypothetical protein